MKKPGGMMIAIGMGKPAKGKSILGLPGGKGPAEEDDAPEGEGSEKKVYGTVLSKAIDSGDPVAIYDAVADICRAAVAEGDDDGGYDSDDE